jgi:hypothetical protein
MEEGMCKYCEEEEVIFEFDSISKRSWGWGYDDTKINLSDALSDTDKYQVFIDRGHLRLADSEDTQCLDHGHKIKISFCPFCGKAIK